MKKKMRIAAVAAAALLAAAPLVEVSTVHVLADSAPAATAQQTITMNDFKTAFLGKINLIDKADASDAAITNPVDVSKALNNITIKRGNKDITNEAGTSTLPAGDYTATYLATIPGFKASAQNRTFVMETTGGTVIGEAYLPAKATTAMGLAHFKVTITSSGIGQPTYLGSTSSELPSKAKTSKKSKKTSKKSRKRGRKGKKSRKNKKVKKNKKHARKNKKSRKHAARKARK